MKRQDWKSPINPIKTKRKANKKMNKNQIITKEGVLLGLLGSVIFTLFMLEKNT